MYLLLKCGHVFTQWIHGFMTDILTGVIEDGRSPKKESLDFLLSLRLRHCALEQCICHFFFHFSHLVISSSHFEKKMLMYFIYCLCICKYLLIYYFFPMLSVILLWPSSLPLSLQGLTIIIYLNPSLFIFFQISLNYYLSSFLVIF